MWHHKTLEELAYFRVRNSISLHTSSEEAKDLFQQKLPLTSSEEIEELKTLSREWERVLTSKNASSIKSWEPVHTYFKVLKAEGSTLEQEQIYSILQFCQSALLCIQTLNAASKTVSIKHLLELSETLPATDLTAVDNEISRILDKDGQLKDLPVLREIRQKIASIRNEIDSALKKYTSDSSLSSVLASNVPAFRADRQVLAVRANQRGRISGIVHEVSQSGATMFIEPDEVVRKNNELIQEEYHLAAETRKIFTELTGKIAPYGESMRLALKTMIRLDQTCAAARWGLSNNCVYALPCEDNLPPQLIEARHPLLGDKAVPIDMKMLDGKNVLIITGPNTGGKTVSLKTFALLSLLNQTGFPVPAADGTRLPVFDSIFADIGDEQSIDQSLSTFSAHMKNIAAAVKHADSKSLVLLDELGSGTDPQEGGAVGMAVLDQLIEKKAFVLVTTHHGILKNYGYSNQFCVNASVDFDADTLSPTYRLLMGVPGESHALDIAKRSGLPSSTVNKARSYISTQQADVSTLIKGLTDKHTELARLEKEAKGRENLLIEKELKFQQKLIRLREQEIELQEKQQRDASSFLIETRKQLENLVRVLREGEITREKTLSVKQFISDLTGQIQEQDMALEEEKQRLEKEKHILDEKLSAGTVISENGIYISKDNSKHSSTKKTKKKLSNKEALAQAKNTFSDDEAAVLTAKAGKSFITKAQTISQTPLEFIPGAEVIHNITKAKGTLIEQARNGSWSVQMGSIKMTFKEKDLTLIQSSALRATVSIELAKNTEGQSKPEFELRLLGMREEEAIKALEKQLDLCQIHNLKSFSVIHGKGNGILQQAVQDYLSHYPAVKSYRFARAEDGGFGKTYVELI